MDKQGILEGILFVVGNDGVDEQRLLEILEIEKKELYNQIAILKEEYENEKHGINLEFLGGKYKLVTKREHKDYYTRLIEIEKHDSLSQASLETLAVVAYKGPVTRSTVDEIRGIDSTYQLRKLVYRNLIKEVGRSDLPGRPILYGVTDEFLDYLGLASLEELPSLEEIHHEEKEETNLYESKYVEE